MTERTIDPPRSRPTVVVGTDFSGTAARALAEARMLAELLDARLDVVHVADGFHVRTWEPLAANELWLADMGVDRDQVHVRHGVPWVELVRQADKVRALLLVVGSHGASGSHSVALGATASRVAAQARCPVVLVSERVNAHMRNGEAARDLAAALARQTREPTMETGQ